MIRTQTCGSCSKTFTYDYVAGRLRRRCDDCAKAGRRVGEERQFSGTVTITCKDCGVAHTYPHRTGPRKTRCDLCVRERNAERQMKWRAANPERNQAASRRGYEKVKSDPVRYAEWLQRGRDNALIRTYGITRAEVDAMREAQGDLCAICGNGHKGVGDRLHIDHCHTTGEVRGLLCSKCNTALGLLDDDPDRMRSMIEYVERNVRAC